MSRSGMFLALGLILTMTTIRCCVDRPHCSLTKSNFLRDAVSRENKSAVCRAVPSYVGCLEQALAKCGVTKMLLTRRRIPEILAELKRRFPSMCPGYSLTSPHHFSTVSQGTPSVSTVTTTMTSFLSLAISILAKFVF